MNTIAKRYPPGEHIFEEIEERNWTVRHLSEVMAYPYQDVHDLVFNGKHVTGYIAEQLAKAFGTSAEYWSNLQEGYDAWRGSNE